MKNEDDLKKKLKKNLFSIALKFRGKPFLGLAQLSKILLLLIYHQFRPGKYAMTTSNCNTQKLLSERAPNNVELVPEYSAKTGFKPIDSELPDRKCHYFLFSPISQK